MSGEVAKIFFPLLFFLSLWLTALYRQFKVAGKLVRLQKAVYEERALLLTSNSKYVREVVVITVKEYLSDRTNSTGPK